MMPNSCNTSTKCCRRKRTLTQIILTNMDANYYSNYLREYLTDAGDVRQDDEDFVSARADAASEEYEVQRRAGAPPPCAQELAMAVLMEGLE